MVVMPCSVLVVDDDTAFRALAAKVLRGWGFTVAGEAASVAEAEERAAALRPDAVVLDVTMPDGNGLALSERLSALPWRPRIVLISSDPEVTTPAAAQRAGALGFLPKTELLDPLLRRLLAGQ